MKQTEIGLIPEDWEVKELGECVDYVKGYPFKSKDYLTDGVRIIRISDTTFNSIKDEGGIFVSTSIANKLKNWELKEGDIIVTTVGSKPPMYDSMVGKTIYIKEKYQGSLLNQNAVLFRNKQRSFQIILNNFFKQKRYIEYIESIFRGNANQASITLDELFKFKIPLPPLAEQEAIANALSDADTWIEKLEELIAKKRLIKQGAMQTLLTPKEDWEVKKLGEVCEIIMGQSPLSENYNDKGIGLPLVQGNADINNRKTIIRNYTSQITKRGKEGDIIMSVRAPVGEIAKATFDCCLGRGVCAFRGKSIDYLYHYMIYSESKWSQFSTGSTFDSVNSNQINDFKINIPKSLSEQERIATILSDMDEEIEALEQQLGKARHIKQGMMQELLTGRTRLI